MISSILHKGSIFGHHTATLSFVYAEKTGGYLQAGMKSDYLHSTSCIAHVIMWRPLLATGARRGLLTFLYDAPRLCIFSRV